MPRDGPPAGIADAIRSEHLELDTVRICRDTGAVLKQFSFAECAGGTPELIGVSRERLQKLLFEAADPDRVALDATVAAVDVKGGSGGAPVVTLESGQEIACRVAVGADGVRSAVARSVGAPSTSFVGQAGYRGIAEFGGPPPVAARTVCQVRPSAATATVVQVGATLCFSEHCKLLEAYAHQLMQCAQHVAALAHTKDREQSATARA